MIPLDEQLNYNELLTSKLALNLIPNYLRNNIQFSEFDLMFKYVLTNYTIFLDVFNKFKINLIVIDRNSGIRYTKLTDYLQIEFLFNLKDSTIDNCLNLLFHNIGQKMIDKISLIQLYHYTIVKGSLINE